MGFAMVLDRVMEVIRPDKQMLMYSATWPMAVRKCAAKHLLERGSDRNVVQVSVGSMNKFTANENITQQFVFLDHDNEKDGHLLAFLEQHPRAKVLVFMGRKRGCTKKERALSKQGFSVTSIHGDKSQSQRERALADFKSGCRNIMFATDVAGRGIHVDDIDYVLNYDLPDRGFEDYVHRIGRTARAGKKGVAISFFVPRLDGHCAAELVKVLETCGQPVPEQLIGMPVSGEKRNGKKPKGGGGGRKGGGRGR